MVHKLDVDGSNGSPSEYDFVVLVEVCGIRLTEIL